jgi:hypothetical protein
MNFLDDYKIYTDKMESPDIFLLWSAYSALAGAAQRKIWLDLGHFKIAPNLYIILVGPAGIVKKSTAMYITKDLFLEIESIKTKSDLITKEAVIIAMEQALNKVDLPWDKTKIFMHSSITIFANEMSVFIKKGDKDFASFITSLFDCQSVFKYTTIKRGDNILVNPFLNIMGCTTPEWISSNISEDIMEGGLTARTILVYAEKPRRPNAIPIVSLEQEEARKRMMKRLVDLTQLVGVFKFSPDATTFYVAWYERHYAQPAPHHKLQGYWHRKHVHLLKLSMLNSLAYSDKLTIEVEDLRQALKVLDMTEPTTEKALKGVGRNILSPITQDILDQIKTAPGGKIELGILLRLNIYRTNHQEFTEIIKTLLTTGQIMDEVDTKTNKHWLRLKV